jgi:hypothetical protein
LQNGVYQAIDHPNAVGTSADGLNDAGQIVGDYVTSSFFDYGYVLTGKKFMTLRYPGSKDTFPSGINSHGVVVGSWLSVHDKQSGFFAILGN